MHRKDIQFLTEGPADKVLLTILEIHQKHIYIQNGNSGIAKAMKNQLKFYHKTVIGMTDKDKKNLPPYFSDFEIISSPDNIFFKRKPETNQYLIFLCCPAIENWLLDAAKSVNILPSDYDLPDNPKEMGKITKRISISNNKKFNAFLRDIKKRKAPAFLYLHEIILKFYKNY